MHSRPARALHVASQPSTGNKALDLLDAGDLAAGHAAAAHELARAPRCGCCLTPRIHLAKYLGSTLFLDDDPALLQEALPLGERAQWSQRLLAACVVAFGRARVTLG